MSEVFTVITETREAEGDGAQQSPGHGACHHTHAETSAHEPEVASPIFPIGDVGDIGASNRTCGAGDAGHDASGVEDPQDGCGRHDRVVDSGSK